MRIYMMARGPVLYLRGFLSEGGICIIKAMNIKATIGLEDGCTCIWVEGGNCNKLKLDSRTQVCVPFLVLLMAQTLNPKPYKP